MARDTVNVGVSGQARVGKSTLLQSVSGLGDDQIPTGQALPVTAVRSRIFHSPGPRTRHPAPALVRHVRRRRPRAVPRGAGHGRAAHLGRTSSPHWPYPKRARALRRRPRRPAELATLLNRLRAMQASLPTYEPDLTGGERELAPRGAAAVGRLPDERQLGARPGGAPLPRGARRADRVPLPARPGAPPGRRRPAGARRVRRRAEPHHVDGLQNEVDAVLLVKRPVEGEGLLGRRRRPRARPDRLRPRLRGPARLRLPRREPRRDRRGAAPRRCATTSAPGQQRRARPVLPGAGERRRRPGRRPRPRARPVLRPSRGADAGDGRRRARRALTPSCGPRLSGSARWPTTWRECSRTVRAARQRGRGPRPRARRLRQDLAGPEGWSAGCASRPATPARTRSTPTPSSAPTPPPARGSPAGSGSASRLARRGPAQHDRRPQQRRLRRRRAQPGPGGDQRLLRGDRRLLHRPGRSSCGTGRRHGRRRDRRRCSASATGDDALRRFAACSTAPQPCPRLRRAVRALLAVRLDYRSQLHPRVRAELDGLALQERDPQSPASSATRSSSRSRRTAPSSSTPSSCRWPSRPRT